MQYVQHFRSLSGIEWVWKSFKRAPTRFPSRFARARRKLRDFPLRLQGSASVYKHVRVFICPTVCVCIYTHTSCLHACMHAYIDVGFGMQIDR